MKRAVVLLGLLAACKADGGGDDYGVLPGPGRSPTGTQNPPTGGGPTDGGVSDAIFDGGIAISGQLCVVSDLRTFGTAKPGNGCAAGDLGNLRVSAGARTTITGADGKFTLLAPEGQFTWRVSNAPGKELIVPTVMASDANPSPVIPVVIDDTYNALLGVNGFSADFRIQGGVFVRVLAGGLPIAGVTATSSPPTEQGALYDSASADSWTQTTAGTSTSSVVWFAGFQPAQAGGSAPVSISLVPSKQTTPNVPTGTVQTTVQEGAITFVTTNLE